MKDKIKRLKKMIIEALNIDGSHHKQWYLEQMLQEFVINFDRIKEQYGWEDGIAP